MADKGVITREDIFKQEAINAPLEYSKNLNVAIASTQKMLEIASKLNDSSKSVKLVQNTRELSQANKENAIYTEQVATAYKEQQRAEKNLITLIERKKIATESTNRALVKERLETQILNKEVKDQAIITSNLTGAYRKLNLQRTQAKRKLLDLIASEKASNSELRKAEKNYQRLDTKIRRADKAVGDFTKNVGNYKSGVSGLTKTVRGLVGAFGVVEGIKLAFRIGSDLIKLQSEVKGVDFAFDRLGERGQDALLRIKKSTRGLLSDLDIKRSLVDLDNFNISLEESDVLMEFLAVRSAQTGTSIDKLKDSLVEGLSKESKLRIDNLGISASELNDELSKTPDFVTAVAKIAKREVKEAGNILDEAGNSQEMWNASLDNFKVAISGSSFLSKFSSGLYSIGQNLLELLTPSKELTIQLEDQAKKVIDLNKNLNPLIYEYDNLKRKTNLSKTEQERLKNVITDISKIVPTAISQFDKYGNALDINSDKAKDFINNQKALLLFRNKEALEEEKEALRDYQKEIRSLNTILSTRNADGDIVQNVIKGGKVSRVEQKKLSDETIADYQAQLGRLQQLEIGAKQSIEQLSGDYLEKYLAREKERTQKELEEIQERAKALGISIKDRNAQELKLLIRKIENRKKEDKKNIDFQGQLKKSEFELSKERIQINIDKNKKIATDNDVSFEQHLRANIELKNNLLRLNEVTLNEEERLLKKSLANKEISKNEYNVRIQLLALKKQSLNEDVDEQITKNLQGHLEQRFKDEKEKLEDVKKLNDSDIEEKLDAELRLLKDKKINVEQYNQNVAQIKKDALLEDLQNQEQQILKSLQFKKFSEEQKKELQRKYADIRKQINEAETTDEIENLKKTEEQKRKIIGQTSGFIANALGLDSNNIAKLMTGIVDGFDSFSDKIQASLAVAGDVINSISNISADFSQARIDEIDAEIEKNDEKYNSLLDNENLTKEQRILLERERKREEDKLEKKKRAEKTKQAKLQKANTLTQIALQTSLGIISALAQVPKFDFGISANLLAGIIGSVGAVQFALAAARPIPKFKDGHLQGTHQGWAITNDGGKQEILERNGIPRLIQGWNTPIYMQKGDKVYKSKEDYQQRMAKSVFKDLETQNSRVSKAQRITANDNRVNEVMIASIVANEFSKYANGSISSQIKKGFKGVVINNVLKDSGNTIYDSNNDW